MNDLLVDASVAVKWLIAEEYSDQSLALLDEAYRQEWRFICPPHFTSEVINVLYRRTRRNEPSFHLNPDDASEALDEFFNLEFEAIRAEELYWHAWAVANEYQISSIYDALYVALADLHATPVWTADHRLVRTVGDANLVRWIGDYEG